MFIPSFVILSLRGLSLQGVMTGAWVGGLVVTGASVGGMVVTGALVGGLVATGALVGAFVGTSVGTLVGVLVGEGVGGDVAGACWQIMAGCTIVALRVTCTFTGGIFPTGAIRSAPTGCLNIGEVSGTGTALIQKSQLVNVRVACSATLPDQNRISNKGLWRDIRFGKYSLCTISKLKDRVVHNTEEIIHSGLGV